jgi:ferredoxin-NADP reductase
MSLKVRLASIERITTRVKRFHFAAISGELPPFSPGSSLRLHLPVGGGRWNSYSLIADPWAACHYTIAVRKEDPERSRGGSIFLHEQAREGDIFEIQAPGNQFLPIRTARQHLLIAGGIGITPFLSYLPTLAAWGAPVELHYGFRGAENAAFFNELRQKLGSQLRCYDSAAGARLPVEALLREQPAGTHVYVCGPLGLIEAVRTAAEKHGWPANHVHFEQFSAGETAAGRPFAAQLTRTGKTIAVSENESLLEALEREKIAVPFSCRIGGCGTCHVRVLAGEAEHHDHCLSAEERADGMLLACVSRAVHDKLTLDL